MNLGNITESQNEVSLEDRERILRQKKIETEEEIELSNSDDEKEDNANVYLEEDHKEPVEEEEEYSPEELQMLEEENARLYEELMSVQDGIQQVEHKVVKIAELQEIFTEKVLQQKDDIELISRNAIATTENVKDGNEELRKAIQNQASVRVYILFFLLVMSFSLLFLDWYND